MPGIMRESSSHVLPRSVGRARRLGTETANNAKVVVRAAIERVISLLLVVPLDIMRGL